MRGASKRDAKGLRAGAGSEIPKEQIRVTGKRDAKRLKE
ncbi:hypothetical protein VCHA41O245_100032 [Vibrio chagasii]|nr:hypothetical protein VCHA41O245_100032 [Vibrio chagasii]